MKYREMPLIDFPLDHKEKETHWSVFFFEKSKEFALYQVSYEGGSKKFLHFASFFLDTKSLASGDFVFINWKEIDKNVSFNEKFREELQDTLVRELEPVTFCELFEMLGAKSK